MAALLVSKFSEKILIYGLNSRRFLNQFNRFCGRKHAISARIHNSIGKPRKNSSNLLFSNSNATYFYTDNSRNASDSSIDSLRVVKDVIAKEWHFPDVFLHTLSVNCGTDLKIRSGTTLGSSAVVRLMAPKSHSVTSDVRIFNDGNGILFLDDEDNNIGDDFSLHVEVPIRCAIIAKVRGKGNAELIQIECNQVDIWIEEGNFQCSKLKCGLLTVKCQGGNILSNGSFHGCCNLETRLDGNIFIDRFQGPNMNLKTENGNIETKAVYCEHGHVKTAKGNVSLANLHADCKVISEQGNIHANGLTGSLKAETGKGNITVQASQTSGIDLISKEGNIDIKLSENMEPLFDLVGETVSLDPRFSERNGRNSISCEFPNVIARCPRGKISIGVQDWFSSLNLKT